MSKSSSGSRSGVYDLPHDILMEIFSRLSAKSVGKLRCLSKAWRTRLSSKEFIYLHLHYHDHEEILTANNSTLYYKLKDDQVARKIEVLPLHHPTEMVGHCNGLVLLAGQLPYPGPESNIKLLLLNPVTKQCVTIPYAPVHQSAVSGDVRMHGFGYVDSDHYKIVSLSHDGHGPDQEGNSSCVISVYSSKMGVWEILGLSPYGHKPELCTRVFLNGAIHWFGFTRRTSTSNSVIIAAFDLANEVFHEIPIPTDTVRNDIHNYHWWNRFKGPFALRGSLCIVERYCGGSCRYCARTEDTNIWVMEEYGIAKSWTKLVTLHNYLRIIPFFITGDDHDQEIMCAYDGPSRTGDLKVYNLQSTFNRDVSHSSRHFESSMVTVDGGPDHIVDVHTFVESLVSPHQAIACCKPQENEDCMSHKVINHGGSMKLLTASRTTL